MKDANEISFVEPNASETTPSQSKE